MKLKQVIAAITATVAVLVGAALPASAATILHEFYLPMPEADIKTANNVISANTNAVIFSTFSIVATGNSTVIYYDQWEDGYEVDLGNPTQSTTKIWGDGNDANGIPPGFTHDPVGLPAGTVITLTNNVPIPRNPANFLYDARDRVGGTKALVITRAAWPASIGPVFAGAASVLATMDYGTNYVSPVGQDMTDNLFRYVGMFIMAQQNNTTVFLDPNGNGTGSSTVTLDQGQTYLINGGVKKGGRIVASKPVQADLLTGKVGAQYASDWFTLIPREQWSTNYITPVASSSANSTYVYLFNPNTNALNIRFLTRSGSGILTIPGTNGVLKYTMPVASGASFASTNGQSFSAVCTVAASAANDTAYNWGFTLLPTTTLTTEAVVGWGPGSSDYTRNGSPVWVTPQTATTIYVDYKGDKSGPLTDPQGGKYDVSYNLATMESKTIYVTGTNDQTALRVYTLDNTLFASAWGEDASVAGAGNPYIDAGYTVLPFPVPKMSKTAQIINDPDHNGLSIGDTVQYVVTINNRGLLPLGNLVVIDSPTTNTLAYVTNTTFWINNGVTNFVPDSTSGTAFPLDSPGFTIPYLLKDGESIFTYQCTIASSGTISNSVNISGTTLSSQTVLAPVTNVTVALNFTDNSGVTQTQYPVGGSIYLMLTNSLLNISSSAVDTFSMTVSNMTTGDIESILLIETGTNTGVFRNTNGLPVSQLTGSLQQDGILNGVPGDALAAAYFSSFYNIGASAAATISLPTVNKQLYLSAANSATNSAQFLNRVNPSTVSHTNYTSIDIGPALVGGGGGAITTNSFTSGSTASGNTLTVSSTVNSGANRIILVGVSMKVGAGGDTVNSVKYGGQFLTNVASITDSGNQARTEIWYATNPGTGTSNVVVTASGTFPIVAGVAILNGADQTTPLETANTFEDSNGQTPSVSATSASGELVFGVLTHANNKSISEGSGQTQKWNVAPTSSLIGIGSLKAGAATSTSISWSWSGASHTALAAVGIKPASAPTMASPATNVLTFAQSPVLAAPFTIVSGSPITITNYVTVTNGNLGSTTGLTAVLRFGGTNILTLTNPTTNAAATQLIFSNTMTTNFTVPAGGVISYDLTNNQSGTALHVNYDSPAMPSKITLPTTTAIRLQSLGVYDASYASGGGSVATSPTAGQTLYARAIVTDPFGSYDISSVSLLITNSDAATGLGVTMTGSSLVFTNGLTNIYEYVWTATAIPGTYSISGTANEGNEGVTDSAATSVTLLFQDLGTPSTTEFTGSLNGTSTNAFGNGGTIFIRVTDANRNTNNATTETLTVTLTSKTNGVLADTKTVTLTETGNGTGIFAGSIGSSTNSSGPTTILAPVSAVLTATYTDTMDSSDVTTATGIIMPPTAVPSISVSESRVTPSISRTTVSNSVVFQVQILNNGGTTLNNVSLTNFYTSGALSFVSASVPPVSSNNSVGGLIWPNLGNFTPGMSTNITLNFLAIGAATPATNITTAASVGGATNSASAGVTITQPQLTITETVQSPAGGTAGVSNDVVFKVVLLNSGSTAITSLPLEDNFSGSQFLFITATNALATTNALPDGFGSGSLLWNNILTNYGLSQLNAGQSITNYIVLRVTGAGFPANNTVFANFGVDINGDSVPSATATAGTTNLAAKITGFVYNDTDTNNVISGGDTGLEGVTISLYTDPNHDGNPADGQLIQITSTLANGSYELLNLATGSYVVVETDPAGFASITPANNQLSITFLGFTTNSTASFLDYVPATTNYSTIRGLVWIDGNANSVTNLPTETGLTNADLSLYSDLNSNGVVNLGEPIITTTTSDSSGSFSFGGIVPGRYVVVHTPSAYYYSIGSNAFAFNLTNGVTNNVTFFDRLRPTAVDDVFAAGKDTGVLVKPLTNDVSPNGDVLTLLSVSATNGTATILNSTNVLFIPTAGYTGTAYVSYAVVDAFGGSNTALMTFTVTNRIAPTVTAATGGTAISADTVGGAWTTLTGPTYKEGIAGDLGISTSGTGTFVLNAPSGFEFNTGVTVSLLVNGSSTASQNLNGVANGGTNTLTVTSSTITLTITNASTVSNLFTWQNIQVRPTAGTPLASGNLLKTGTSLANSVTNSVTLLGPLVEVPGAAAKLGIATQPSATAIAGVAFTQQPVVQVLDQFGNVVTNAVNAVTGTRNLGTGNLQGPVTTNAVSGVATYAALYATNTGTINITFSSPGLTSTNSSNIVIGGGAVTGYVIIQQPTNEVAGAAFGTQLIIKTVDQYGNFSTNGLPASLPITIALTGGTGPLLGTTNYNIGTSFGSGTVTTTGLELDVAGIDKQLTVTDGPGGYPDTAGSVFTIRANLPAGFIFVQQPSNTGNGQTIIPAVTVQVRDAYSNNVPTNGFSVTLVLTNSSTGTLSGTTSQSTSSTGLATFGDLSIDLTGTKFLAAVSGTNTPAISTSFVITNGTLTQATGGTAISADTTGGAWTTLTGPIYSEGANSNVGPGTIIINVPSGFEFDTGGTAPTVLITRLSGSGGNALNIDGVASGTSVPVTAVSSTQITLTITNSSTSGVTDSLTWQNIRVRPTAGTPLSSGNLLKTGTAFVNSVTNSVTSLGTLIEVPGAANKLAIATQPSATAIAGTAFAQQPVVDVVDQFGNVVTNAVNVISAARNLGTGTLQGTTNQTAAAGIATYTNLAATNTGTINITFTATGLTSVTSSNIVVGGGAVVGYVIIQQPTNEVAGTPFGSQLIIKTVDAFGNFSTNGLPASLPITINLNAGTGPLLGTTNYNIGTSFGSGTVTTTGLELDVAGTDKQLTVTDGPGGYPDSATSVFTIRANVPAAFVFVQQPTDTGSGQTIAPAVTVQVKDAYGNSVATNGFTVTLSLTNGSTGTLSGTTNRNTDATGLATFNDLSIDTTGIKYLAANGGTNTPAVSAPFTLSGGTVVQATGGSAISADTTGGAWTTLTGPTYLEGAAGNVGTGTFILNAPAGFEFDTGGVAPTVRVDGSATSGQNINGTANHSSLALTVTSTTLTLNIASASSVTNYLTWQNVRVRPTAGTPLATGNLTKTGTAVVNSVSNSVTSFGTLIEVPGAAAKLGIGTQPSATAIAGVAFVQQPVVDVLDQFGNLVTNAVNVVTATRSTGSGTLQGTTNQTAVAGVATYTDLSHLVTGTINITFSSPGLTSTNSSNVVISGGPVVGYVIVQQPTNEVAGVAFGSQLVIKTVDAYGNYSTNGLPPSLPITITLTGGTGPLLGTTTYDIGTGSGSGTVTTTGLDLNVAGNDKQLTVTDGPGGYPDVSGNIFIVRPNVAATFTFVQQPTDTGTGATITPAVTVQVKDAYGNNVATNGFTVTLSLTNASTGTLSGTTNQNTDATGLATFNDLSIDTTGTKYLAANGGTNTPAVSSSFVIGSGTVTPATGGSAISADTALTGVWTSLTGPIYTEAANGNVGTGTIILNVPSGFIFDTGGVAPTVLITRVSGSGSDSFNIDGLATGTSVPVTSVSATQITLTITNSSSGGVTDSLTWQNIRVRPTAGTPLSSGNITKTGTAVVNSVTNAVTSFGTLIEVPGAAAQLAVGTQPSATAIAGVPFAQQPVVDVLDQFGNLVTNAVNTITATRNAGTGTLQGMTTTNATAGVATYADLNHLVAGTIDIVFSSAGLTSVTSAPVVISGGPVVGYVIVQQPITEVAGVPFGSQLIIKTVDIYGNYSTNGLPPSLPISVSLTGGTGPLIGTTTYNIGTGFGSGTVTTTGLQLNVAGNDKQLTVTDGPGGYPDVSTSVFTVIPNVAATFVFVQQPTGEGVNETIAPPVTIQVKDAYGNNVLTNGFPVTLSLTNASTGVLNGTTTQATDGTGLATFNDLSVTLPGTKYLAANGGTNTPAVSTSFIIANGVLTAATGGLNISADTAVSGVWTMLTGPIYNEGANGDVSTGTIVLNAPSGFIFDIALAAPTVKIDRTFGTGADSLNIDGVPTGTSVPVDSVTPSAITLTITNGTSGGVVNSLTWQNIRVRPSAGTPLASGNITKSGTSVMDSVTNAVSNFGTLTEIPGVGTNLVFVTQPTNEYQLVVWGTQPVVRTVDQFGNYSTNGLPASQIVTMSISFGSGALYGTTNLDIGTAAGNGTVSYTDLSIDESGLKRITASSPGFSSVESSTFTLLPLSTPVLISLTPPQKSTGGPGFVMTLTGQYFSPDSVVKLDGVAHTTTFVNSNTLTAVILAADLTSVHTFAVTVERPHVGISGSLPFNVVQGVYGSRFGGKTDYATGPGPTALYVADFDLDNNMDIAVANYLGVGTNRITILRGGGDGSFPARSDFITGAFPLSIDMGDFNRDGNRDLVVANSGDATITVLGGKGSGIGWTMETKATLASGPTPMSVATSDKIDLNLDSNQDFVVVNGGDGSVSNYLNGGNWTFNPSQQVPSVMGNCWVALGDLVGDTNVDMVIVNSMSNTVSIFQGDGHGSFTPSTVINVSDEPVSAICRDLNNDGLIDIITANYSSHTISVLLNRGGGVFDKTDYTVAGSNPRSVYVASMGPDDTLDIVTANFGSGDINVFFGRGDGTFSVPEVYESGANPWSVYARNVNHGSFADIIVANFGANTVSILLDATPVAIASVNTVLEDSVNNPINMAAYQGTAPYQFVIAAGPANGVLRTSGGSVISSFPALLGAYGSNVTYTPNPDFYGADHFYFFAIGTGGVTSQVANATINVTAVADPPRFTPGTNVVVLEDAGAVSIPWATGVSAGGGAESGQSLTFVCSASPAGILTATPVISSSGVLSFTPAANANGVVHVTVYLRDSGPVGSNMSPTNTFDITVVAVNDAPSFNKGANIAVLSTSGANSKTNWITPSTIKAGGADEAGQTIWFEVVSNSNTGLFSVQPAVSTTGTLTFTPNPAASGTATIGLRLRDNGGTANGGSDTSAVQTFTITTSVSAATKPVATAKTYTVTEDSADGLVGLLSSGGYGQPLFVVSTGPTNGFLRTMEGAVISSYPCQLTSSNVTYTPNPNVFGSDHFFFYVYNDSTMLTSSVVMATVTISAVNDAPTFTPGTNNVVVLEDSGTFSAPWASNLSAGPYESDTLTFVVLSATPSGILSANPTISSAGVLGFAPKANSNGVVHVVYYLKDSGLSTGDNRNSSVTNSFDITVVPVNDVPSFTKGANLAVKKTVGAYTNATWIVASTIKAGPLDEIASQTVWFEIVSNTNPGLFTVQPAVSATGSLTFTPNATVTGSATLGIRIHDNGGTDNGGVDTSAVQTFVISTTN